jgi:hypothetical protein
LAQDIIKLSDLDSNQVLHIHQVKEDYDDPLQHFTYALRAAETKRQYPKRLKMFMDFVQIEGDLKQQAKTLKEKIKQDPIWFKLSLMRFFEYQKERARKNDIAFSTISNYYKAIKLFVDMNFDAPIINWKKITKGIPSGRKSANDRAPTIEELKKLSEYPDRRIKPIVYLMASSGIRIGAFDMLKWKDIHPIIENDEIVAAKLVVYAGDGEQYTAFTTPESYFSILEWMNYRKLHGEKITGDSWIMRDLWQTTELNYGAKFGVATYPKQLKSSGIKSLIERALKAQGLVKPLNKNNKERRREWKGCHGLRKFYQSNAEKVMKTINVEITMGHNIGITASYYKPNEREILADYLKAVYLLTFSQNNEKMDKKVKDLEEQNKNTDYIIKGKLQEKDQEIVQLKKEYEITNDAFAALSDKVSKLIQEIDFLKNK